ncbi:MAG: DNA-binding domain-containing protein [Roseovarius sp.]|uniref:HvfC/BufC N-terminal domain-containing protein n=1 Tax=Roseobacteraceae TaxID=2854170 RepID=UPI0032F03934
MSPSQSTFRAALLDNTRPTPDGLSDGQGRPAGRRFAVYRNNVAASLTDALETSFPAIARLIGEENFRKTAGTFLRQHPPQNPLMMSYGADFPAFLETFQPLQHLGYLPDVARLEQALRISYHAADATPVDPAILQTLKPDALAETRFTLAPATRLIASRWPIHAIWAFNMEDGPKPQPGPQSVLITRPDYDPQMTPVSPGTAALITAIQSGATLSEATDTATATDPGFDLTPALSLLLGTQAITDITTGAS